MAVLSDLIGNSPAIRALRDQVARLLDRPSETRRLPPILLLGETGTGKGLLARAIHRAGPRRDGQFIDINCAAIPETLLEAEMFGFERGAFTDARQAKPGLFEAANGGTLFLDEIGFLPDVLQTKLLKVIEERTVRRLGSTRSQPVDVSILAATSADLEDAVREDRFRLELYHRLAVFTLRLPPLRERGADILVLAEHLLGRACADYRLPPRTFADEAGTALCAHHWPGNVRELANVIERAVLLADGPVVTAYDLALTPASPARTSHPDSLGGAEPGPAASATTEREDVLAALQQTNWNLSRAAERLQIPRNTLRYRMERHGLRPPPPSRRRARTPGDHAERAEPASAGPIGGEDSVAGDATNDIRAERPTGAGVIWERRRLALLRADLMVPPELDVEIETNRPLEVLAEKIQSFGGRIEELGLTQLVAAFGLEPIEDAPRRAALAAMAMHKAGERARRASAVRVTLKTAIHVDDCLVSYIGGSPVIDLDGKRRAETVLQCLIAAADPDAIVLTEVAATFLARRFDVLRLEDGRREAGPTTYLLRGPEGTGFGVKGRITAFVGRQRELALLDDRFQLTQSRRGQAIAVMGEPGIGKSRLLFEFCHRLAKTDVICLEGRCFSYATGTPYLPVISIVRQNCGITEADSPDVIGDKVDRTLERLGIPPAEGAPYLLHLLGLTTAAATRLAGTTAEALKARLFETLRKLWLRESEQRPLVIVVEDLHWIDATSEELLASWVDSLVGARILLLVSYRPGYQASWLDRSSVMQITLSPLTRDESLAVVRSALHREQVSLQLSELILAKAEGNPFFLEELCLAVGDNIEIGEALGVPPTIQGVLSARSDRLTPVQKRLLQEAAVVGKDVPVTLLRAMAEEPEHVDARLRQLQATEFLIPMSTFPEITYTFKHALTHDVAYQSLPPSRRRALHAAAGRALEALYADRLEDVYDRLAHHYAKTPDAAKAVEYLIRFADKSARSYANADAARTLEEALVHVVQLPAADQDRRVLEIVTRLAHSLYFLGRLPEMLDLLLTQGTRVARVGDRSLAGSYYFWLGHTYSYLNDYEAAIASAERALEEGRRSGDDATLGMAYYVLARVGFWSGAYSEGVGHGRQAAALLEHTGESLWLGQSHWAVGLNYLFMGELDAALLAEKQAHAVGEASGDPRLQTYSDWAIGWIHATREEWREGIEACQRSLDRSRDAFNTACALGWLGFAYMQKGDLDEAIPRIEESIRQFRRIGYRGIVGWFNGYLGEALRRSGELTKSRAVSTEGLEIGRTARNPYAVGLGQRNLGWIALATGDHSDAERYLLAALETFAKVQARFEVGQTHLALAELARARGELDGVAAHLRDARAVFTALAVPRFVAKVERLAGETGVRLTETVSG